LEALPKFHICSTAEIANHILSCDALHSCNVRILNLIYLLRLCKHLNYVTASHVLGFELLSVEQHLFQQRKPVMYGYVLVHKSPVFVSTSIDDIGEAVDESIHGIICLFGFLG
jgi:hypothetical protein